MAYVPNSPITALYNNTSPGTPADPNAMDNAIGAIVGTINENYDFVTNLLNTTSLSSMNIYNVNNYGAKGDGVADDTASIQSAIDVCAAAGGGTVYIPKGTYKITTTLNKKNNVSIVGSGKYLTVLNWSGSNDLPIIECTNNIIKGTFISHLTLTNTDGVTNGIIGVQGGSDAGVYNSTGMTFDNVRFYKLKYSTKSGSADISFYDCIYNNCIAEYCYYGFWVQGSQTTLFYPRVQNCTYGLVVEYLSNYSKGGVEIYGGVFLVNTNDILVPHVQGTRPCSFYGTWFEMGSNPILQITNPGTQLFTWTFVGCMLSCNATDYVLDAYNAYGVIDVLACMLFQTDVTYSKIFRLPSSTNGKMTYNCNVKTYTGSYEVYEKRGNVQSFSTRVEEQVGITPSTSLTGSAFTTINVTFPIEFVNVPYVWVQSGSGNRIVCTVGNVTTTGFSIFAYNFDSTASTQIRWLAKG